MSCDSLHPVRVARTVCERAASSSTQPNAAVRTAVRHAAGGPVRMAVNASGAWRSWTGPPARRVHSSRRVASVARISASSHSTMSARSEV